MSNKIVSKKNRLRVSAAGLVTLVALTIGIADVYAAGRGGGRGGGSMANTSVSGASRASSMNRGGANTGNINRGNVNTGNVNRGNVNTGNVNRGNVNVGNDINIDIDGGYNHCCGYGGGYYHPIARGAFIGAVAVTTAAVVGSYYYALPATGCTTVIKNGITYSYCGTVYYQKIMSGNDVVYVVVQP